MPPEPEPIGALEDLLEAERAALLAGDLARIERLGPARDALLRDLTTARCAPDTLARLRVSAERNRLLYEAAARGLRAVRERLRALQDGANGLRTYDARGLRSAASTRPATLARRR